ncbi:unnamed protein product [Rotaria sp. Silwood1]|nr:unnamed protein product [Rotaria sp. Silwood1]
MSDYIKQVNGAESEEVILSPESKQPSTRPKQPPTESKQSQTERRQPPTESKQSQTEPKQSSTEPEQPPAEPIQPLTEPKQLPAEPIRPLTEPEQPPAEPIQPLTEPKQLSAEPIRPLTKPEQLPAEPTQPPTRPKQPSNGPKQSPTEQKQQIGASTGENQCWKQIQQLQMALVLKMNDDIHCLLQYHGIDGSNTFVLNDGPACRLLPTPTSHLTDYTRQAGNLLRQLENQLQTNPKEPKKQVCNEEQRQQPPVHLEEQKIVNAVMQQSIPLFKKLVSAEVRRSLISRDTQDNSNKLIKLPPVFTSSACKSVPPDEYSLPLVFQKQQSVTTVMESNFGGAFVHSTSVPPEYFMPFGNGSIGGVQGEINTHLPNILLEISGDSSIA